jgi:hypothetical protein
MALRAKPWLTIDDAKRDIGKLSAAIAAEKDARGRQKLARQLAFAGTSLARAKSTLDPATIDIGLEALKLARKSGAVTEDLNRAAALLAKLRLDAMGCADARIIVEAKKIIAVDGGCLAGSGTPKIAPEAWTSANATVLAAMNRGDFFLVGLGADGRYSSTVRLVDAREPVLTPAEYKKLDAATEIGFLQVAQSELRFGAPEDMERAAKIIVPNGFFKVQVFRLTSGENEKFILVACSAIQAPLPLDQIPEFR